MAKKGQKERRVQKKAREQPDAQETSCNKLYDTKTSYNEYYTKFQQLNAQEKDLITDMAPAVFAGIWEKEGIITKPYVKKEGIAIAT